MSDLIPSPVLLAILQNQIKNAVDKNNVDISKFPIYKTIGDASALTEEEKTDISKNVYQFLIDGYNDLYVLSTYIAEDDWYYYNLSYSNNSILNYDGFRRITFAESYYVYSSINGDVLSTDVIIDADDGDYAPAYNVTLETDEYPHVFFHGNYRGDESDSVIYRFSSGIILDSSSETVQYKIVLATYNVKAAKVTFVEKVLP
ncbi:MAG: hypothetical protein MR384_00235 [Lachnospiraceae bacterium]|nr:hypothetical protein [Lachnospiraceae bacterium]